MFCQDCGEKASGNFCSSCGARLLRPERSERLEPPPLPSVSWRDEVRYKVLLHIPEVRERIDEHARHERKHFSGERFLELCDKLFEPVPGVELSKVASLIAPIYGRLGIRTGKSRAEFVRRRPGEALVAAVCSLARQGQTLKKVHQGEDGCVLEAVLPSDLLSFEGELVVSVRRHGRGVEVEAATRIPGQLYDWGKSRRCLDKLFEDVETLVA